MSQQTNAFDELGVAGTQCCLAGHLRRGTAVSDVRRDVGPCGVAARRAAELRAAACDAAAKDEDGLEPLSEQIRFWNAGVEAFDNGVRIDDCPYDGPSMEQDDWLRGWLAAQLESEETQRGAATKTLGSASERQEQ
jgi:hypothetical protein